jgi:hypothetical protein
MWCVIFVAERERDALGPDVRSSSWADDVLRQDKAAGQVVARDGARVQPAHQA